jgi:TPR repeat protein
MLGLTLAWLANGPAHAAKDPANTSQGLTDFQAGKFAEALEHWRQAASRGDATAALYVGVMYDSGQGIAQNDANARLWYARAAHAGSAAGAFNLGVIYDSGTGVAKDTAQAAHWYARAAALGSARADYNLAMLYETGAGVAKSRERAITFYTSAARLGITAARPHLAALGHPYTSIAPAAQAAQDTAAQDRAMQDFQKAQSLLLSRGTSQAREMATLFRSAADLHNPLAEYDLGYCYEHGMGVPRDAGQAQAYYRQAAHDATDEALRAMAQAGADGLAPHISPKTP